MTKLSQHNLSDIFNLSPDQLTSDAARQLYDAYAFAQEAYGTRLNRVDQPYIWHSLAIVQTLIDLDMDNDTLMAGMLYGVKPDDPHFAALRERFGSTVANIIENLYKLEIYTRDSGSENKKTLEAIRRALLTIVDGDVRVVILRLAVALENLRSASALPPERQTPLAWEVRNIFAPLANRLGIWRIKWEMEDRAFRYLEPEQYHAIASDLAEQRSVRQQRVEAAKAELRLRIAESGIKAEVTGRPKHIYSIYRKMERKGVGIDQIYDAQAVRVIIDQDEPERPGLSAEERRRTPYAKCYQVLGIVHNTWEPIPSEFDDYIQHPKPNGYRSLHTAVALEDGHLLEVQIRTAMMHEEGERGIAAHWAYKEGSGATTSLNRQIRSLRSLLDTIQASSDAVEPTTLTTHASDEEGEASGEEVLAERIYVFTPNGDVHDLPKGATPIDFAYRIHTKLGHECNGAKVNGKMVSLTYKLQSGDRVAIIRRKNGKPRRDWMTNANYTATARARSRIRQWFRANERDQNIAYGRAAVEREIKQQGLGTQVTVEDVYAQFKDEDLEDFLSKVGFGDISGKQLRGALILVQRERRAAAEAKLLAEADDEENQPALESTFRPKTKGLTIMGMEGLHTKVAHCCNPIPPQPIVGYITRGRGATIHRSDCRQMEAKRQQGESDRIVSADWGVESGSYAVPFFVKAYRSSGLLEKIANTLKGQNINLLKTKSSTSKNHTNIYILAEVDSLNQSDWIRNRLLGMERVIDVQSR